MLNNSWSNIEDELLEFSQGSIENLSDAASDFLVQIGFVDEEGKLTELGERYRDSKFIFEDGDHELILRDQLLAIEAVRELCQAFYGQETTRQKVDIFLKSKTDISSNTEVGRLLLLLNEIDIVDYSKKTGSVRFATHDLVEAEGQDSYRVTTRTPYSNIKRLRRCLRECSGQISWVDKHFSKKGLEPLSDEISGENVSEIRILCGTSNVNTRLRKDFQRFEEEMEYRGVDAELRVIVSTDTYHEIHDRWILSETASWNVPPIDSLYQNQEAEIHKTEDNIPFDMWWNASYNIVKDWNSIQPNIQ